MVRRWYDEGAAFIRLGARYYGTILVGAVPVGAARELPAHLRLPALTL